MVNRLLMKSIGKMVRQANELIFFAELVDMNIFFEGWICAITIGCADGR